MLSRFSRVQLFVTPWTVTLQLQSSVHGDSPFGGTDLKPESSRNTQALNIAEDQHFLRKKRIA